MYGGRAAYAYPKIIVRPQRQDIAKSGQFKEITLENELKKIVVPKGRRRLQKEVKVN